MRSTTKISNANSLLYITRNFQNLSKVTSQIALEQQVIELQDDPLSSTVGIKLLNTISKSEQYNRNIKTGIGSLSLLDGFLASCKGIMDKVKNLSVGSANDPTERSAVSIELNQILQSLVSAGNASDGSRYIFGGTQTTTPPFTIVNGRYVNYTGNDESINITIDNGTTMAINCTGTQAYGNMITEISSRDMNPDVNLGTDTSTRLADLNGGQGVPKGKIVVYYSSYPEGLEIDLSNCDTLEDVKDTIEKATLEASRELNTVDHKWLDSGNLDWHDLQDRYVKVTINPEHNGISLQEFDLGEPLPEPTARELKKGLDYSNQAGTGYYYPGGKGVAEGLDGETTVYDKLDYVYGNGTDVYARLRVDNSATNNVATALGIKGTANKYTGDPNNPAANPGDPILDGFIHGTDLNPILSERTLLADLEGYNDAVYTLTNGAKPGDITVTETDSDPNNVFNNWNLTGLSLAKNTGANGELYVRAVNRGTANDPEIYVEVYTCPVDKAKASDLVATGLYTDKADGGIVILHEANDSGLGGTVGVHLPTSVTESTMSLSVDFGSNLQASVHVPAFIEETDADGQPLDIYNIASGWNIRGLDQPPATGYDENHPASTDLDGDVSVNYRFDGANCFIVEICRPAFNDQPAQIIATGKINIGDNNLPPNMANAVSGRVELVGCEGFEGIKGSVYLQIPAGACFASAGAAMGSLGSPTPITYQTPGDSPAGTIVLGGATELAADQDVTSDFTLKAKTTFKEGQVFNQDIILPNGLVLPAGDPLEHDLVLPKGYVVPVDYLEAGTVLAEGQEIEFLNSLAAGTVVPRGSYYTDPGLAFNSDNMGITVSWTDPYTGNLETDNPLTPMGYDVRATFATVEDFNRAVEELGIYVTAGVSDDGKSLEFRSSLAGAYLTISEDTDCYEQMGDVYQQLANLDLNGFVKGVNSDKNGNVYTEVVFHPPEETRADGKAVILGKNGEQIIIDAGYYVRVYSDPDALDVPYEDRDNSSLVAEGFVPVGKHNPDYITDPDNNDPFLPADGLDTLGLMRNLVLEERNDSGVWGTVNLDYYGTRSKVALDENGDRIVDEYGKYVYDPYDNSNITVFPGGLRPEGSRHTTIQEWDMYNIVPGVTCDYAGTYHGAITGDAANPEGPALAIYKDGSHSVMTSRSAAVGELDGNDDPIPYTENGKVILYEVDRYGKLALDADGKPIVAGTMVVTRNELADGQTDSFKLTTGAVRNYGQEREENVFATINDIMDAVLADDLEEIHNRIGDIQKDIDHILVATGDVGARQLRLQLLSERHADDIIRFKSMLTSRVGMDDQALAMAVLDFQAATNAYQAAMQVSATVMQMSLLQYI